MAGGGASSNAPRLRKRVAAETDSSSPASIKRARDGSAFAKCEECNKDVPVALISFHNCSLDAKIKMNLEAQVVDMAGEVKKKPPVKRAAGPKKAKDSKGRKRPPTAFFVFMEDFRKTFKEANPDCKSVATVAKEGGVQWKSMSDEEKKVYIDRAAELKAEYEKAIEADEAEDEQDADEETKDDKDAGDSSEKEEVKDEAEQVDGSSEKEVKAEDEQVDDE